jgi:hypothetical protein
MAIDFPNSPTTGQVYSVGTKSWVYNGSVWTSNASAGASNANIGGMVLIRKQTFSTVASISLDNVFSSAYSNYKIVMDVTTSASAVLNLRWRASGVDNSAATYNYQQADLSNATVYTRSTAQTLAQIAIANGAGNREVYTFDVFSPQQAVATYHNGASILSLSSNLHGSVFTGTNQFDGVTIYPASGTITGTILVYGYSETVGDAASVSATPGLVYITSQTFATASSVSVNNCFTSAYANYLVLLDLSNTSADATVTMKMRVSGVSASTAYYGNVFGYGPTSALSNFPMNNATAFTLGPSDATNTDTFGLAVNVMGPAFARQTRFGVSGTFSLTTSDTIGATGGGMHNTAIAYDGFELLTSAGTITGTVRVYGYR